MTHLFPVLRPATLTLCVALAAPAFSQSADPLTAEEFDAYTRGKTMTYLQGGEPYGTEEYRNNRRVRWAFDADERCLEGVWYEAGEYICFAYDDGGPDQCWQFFRGPGGLRARFKGDPMEDGTVYEAQDRDDPLLCLGPDVGV